MLNKTQPKTTIFHVTHWKAGSQWIYRILLDLARENKDLKIIPPNARMDQVFKNKIENGAIYPTIYLKHDEFYSINLPDNYRKFVVLRDLRDTLISAYFSWRYSHVVLAEIPAVRQKLENLTLEDGLLMLLNDWLPLCADIHESWADSGENFIRYEDLLHNDYEILKSVLIDHCEMKVTSDQLEKAIAKNRFESFTGGRKPGDEDIMAHERKGVSGDWLNYFTPKVTKEFNDRYGNLLLKTGYPYEGT